MDDLLGVLWTLRKHRGGEKVDRAAGMSSAAVRARLRGARQLTVDDLAALLAGMKIDPVEFAAWRTAGFHPEVYLRELEKAEPSQVRHLRQLAARAPAEEHGAEEIRRQAGGLEVLRLVDADAARERALEILRTAARRPEAVDRENRCEAWGTVGAIQRRRGTTSSAAFCLRQALVLGIAGEVSTLRRASTLQRLAYLMSDQGDLEQAEQVLQVARVIAVGDGYAIGRILVSEGALLERMGRLEDAVAAYETSLAWIPAHAWHYRLAALRGLGVSQALRGNPGEALAQLDRVLALVDALLLPSPP